MQSQLVLKTAELFESCREKVGEKLFREISQEIEKQEGEERLLLKWIYANSPLADWGRYDFSLFKRFSQHGLFLRKHSPFAKELPEALFLAYVVHPRVNDEALSDCREFFFTLLKERVEGLSMEKAALAVNEFCAENVSYHGSDERTRSALSAFRFSTGRCGEESVFAVNALRSVGIPARQVYAPLWSHCDDNHAWVEVCLKDGWHFFGACEIEEILDLGWFNGAASRAMFAYARCFSTPPEGKVLLSQPPVYYVDVLPRYAKTTKLSVLVRDENGPVEGAKVSFEILNYSKILPVAVCQTDKNGCVEISCGRGSLFVRASNGERSKEVLVDTREQDTLEISLCAETCKETQKFEFFAPEASDLNYSPSEKQREMAQKKRARADALRTKKIPPAPLEGLKKYELFEGLWNVLSKKDREDADPDVLEEAILRGQELIGKYPDEVFFRDLLSPRVENEPLFLSRKQIYEFFSEEERESFKRDPEKIYERAYQGEVTEEPLTRSYYSPLAILRGQSADRRSRDILFVQICRALGIPARIRALDGKPQYFKDGKFVDVVEEEFGTVVLKGEGVSFSLSRLLEGGRDLDLNLPASERLSLPAGEYRLVTQNRLPNGNSLGVLSFFSLRAGEQKCVEIPKNEASLDDLTVDIPIHDLWDRGDGVFVFADPGAEPTEHIFAEMEELKNVGNFHPMFLIREGREPSKRMLALEKKISFFEPARTERLMRALFVDMDKLPLVLLVKNHRARFVSAGYRVGTVELVLKIMERIN